MCWMSPGTTAKLKSTRLLADGCGEREDRPSRISITYSLRNALAHRVNINISKPSPCRYVTEKNLDFDTCPAVTPWQGHHSYCHGYQRTESRTGTRQC